MKYKFVLFGNLRTKQLLCPRCGTWQFETNICDKCNYDLRQEKNFEQDKTEYRSEPKTWRDRVKDAVKIQIYERDGYICQYCGLYCYESYIQNSGAVTIDHMLPVSAGGTSDIENLVTCCRECNMRKTNKIFKSFDEARDFLNGKEK